MEKIITIKPLELSEVRVSTASPITKRRTKISHDTIVKFMKFNEIKRGAIEEEELIAIKPELDVNTLSEYEENLNLNKLLAKLNKANTVLRKYGYFNLCISPENVKKLIENKNEELVEENARLNRENTAIKDTINEMTITDEPINDEVIDVDNDIKLIA